MAYIEQSEKDAAKWMARKLSGDMTADEIHQLEAWLGESSQNRVAFEAFEMANVSLDDAETELLADSFEQELIALSEISRPSVPWISIAATGAVAVIAGTLFAVSQFTSTTHDVFVTAFGERAGHILEDGSSVTLNTNSKVAIEYSRANRLVQLDNGEALFNVERNPKRPFIVETRHGDITVTGTVFTVFSEATETIISVVSGAVDISPVASPRVTLMPGQQIKIDNNGRGGTILNFDANNALAWRNGKARYNTAPLGSVITDLNRYFERPIVLGDPSLADLSVTGEFGVEDQQTVVNALTVAFSLEQTLAPSQIILHPAEEPR